MSEASDHQIAALQRDAERFQRLVEICPNGIAICSGGSIVCSNRSLQRLLDVSAEDLIGSSLAMHIAEDVRSHTTKMLDEILGAEDPHTATVSTRLVRPDGAEIDVAASVDRVESAGGGDRIVVLRPSATFRQAPLLQKEELLQLAHLRRMAVFGELTSSLLHELGQPLTAAKGASEMLVSTASDRGNSVEFDRSSQIVAAAVAKAAAQFRRVWDFVRVKRPNVELFDLCDSVRIAMELCEAAVRHAGIAMRFEHDAHVAIKADRSFLELVLVNLIQRSITALSSHGASGAVIDIKCCQASGQRVEVHISHNGDLLPAERVSLHDVPEAQSKNSSGLTLAVCRTIVEENGGVFSLSQTDDPRSVQYRLIFLIAAGG